MRFSTAFESASILFVELCGFSAIGARLSPEDLINLLNVVRAGRHRGPFARDE